MMARRAAAVLAIMVAVAMPLAAMAETPLPRAASTGLCADQFLLMLADREQIVSVSWQAEGDLSHQAGRAKGLPVNRGRVEDFLYSRADVVLTHEWINPNFARTLERFGIGIIRIPQAEDFDAIADVVRDVAVHLGREERGEEVIAEMQARLDALSRRGGGDAAPVAAYVRPGGGGASTGTSVHSAMAAGGVRNLQEELGQRGWSDLALETLVANPPDVFIVSYFDTSPPSVFTLLTRHTVFQRMLAARPAIEVPGKLWVCGTPALAEAAALIAEGRARLEERRIAIGGE